jgi:hypothetical protein
VVQAALEVLAGKEEVLAKALVALVTDQVVMEAQVGLELWVLVQEGHLRNQHSHCTWS